MINKILAFIGSSKFLIFIVGLFIVQGLFFAVAVDPSDPEYKSDGLVTRGGGVVPDGNRHIGAIYYFAEKPILDGPVVDDMKDGELWMGDLERFPSYFYYYLLSFVIRIPMAFDAPDIVNVMIIRFVGLFIGVLALLVFRKITSYITKSRKIQNLATLALAVTGSFAWLSPAENYDILSLLFFLLFMLASIRLFNKEDPTQIYPMAVWFFLGSITKYTYFPFMGLFGLIALGLYIRNTGGFKESLRDARIKFKKAVKSMNNGVLALLALLLIVSGGLFVERVGVNLVSYQSVSPACNEIHSHEACMNFGVYSRDYNREQAIASGEDAGYSFNIIEYIGFWVARYYASMYAYLGHIWIYSYSPVMYIGGIVTALSVIGMFIYLKVRRVRVLTSTVQRYVAIVVSVLISAQFLYNLDIMLSTLGRAYAHQGRYLLSAVGFIYIIMFIIAAKFYASLKPKNKKAGLVGLITVGLIALLTNAAIVTFFLHATSPDWYSWT